MTTETAIPMDAQQITEQLTYATKAKVSAGTAGGGFFVTVMSYLSEHKDAITALAAIGGFSCTMIATGFTVYFMVESQKMKRLEHKARLKTARRNK